MDALCVAGPLARVLLALGECGRACTLTLEQGARTVGITLARGRLLAVEGVDVEPLGDALRALGALAPARGALLASTPASTPSTPSTLSTASPIGARLVALGATSPEAVTRAREAQLVGGIVAVLRAPRSHVRRRAHAVTGSLARVPSVGVTSAVWCALLGLASELPESALAGLAGGDGLVLTPAGKRRVQGLLCAVERGALAHAQEALWAASRARDRMPPVVVTSRTLARALSPEPVGREARLVRAVLRALEALGDRVDRRARAEETYRLLLRKRCELSRNASERVLLDLPEGARPEQARRAFRRLAMRLHPDRFQGGDARFLGLSGQVLGALARAEQALRALQSA